MMTRCQSLWCRVWCKCLTRDCKHKIRYGGMHKTLFYNCQQCNNEHPPSKCYIPICFMFIIFFVIVSSHISTLVWDFLCCQQTITFLIADPLRRIEMVCQSSQSFGRNLQKVLLFQHLKLCCGWLGKIEFFKPYSNNNHIFH